MSKLNYKPVASLPAVCEQWAIAKQLNKAILLVIGLIAFSFLFVWYIFAWTEPTTTPPGGNVSAPINIGTSTQYRAGALGIGGVFTTDNATYLATLGGNVGIGTTIPTVGYKLDVMGNVIGDDFCLRTGRCLSGLLDSWISRADFGGTRRRAAVGFSIGTKGYIGGGRDASGRTGDFWEYNPGTNIWTQKASFTTNGLQDAVGFSIGTKGYIGTGLDNSNHYQYYFREYNPGTNTWTGIANFGGSERHKAVGFSIGTKGYIGTGFDFTSTRKKDFWEYNPGTNLWTQKADFGGSERQEAVGFSIGTKGYIGTGIDSTGYKKDFWEYDPATNPPLGTWTRKADFDGIARYDAVGFSIGDKGYIGTGWNDPAAYAKDFYEYQP